MPGLSHQPGGGASLTVCEPINIMLDNGLAIQEPIPLGDEVHQQRINDVSVT